MAIDAEDQKGAAGLPVMEDRVWILEPPFEMTPPMLGIVCVLFPLFLMGSLFSPYLDGPGLAVVLGFLALAQSWTIPLVRFPGRARELRFEADGLWYKNKFVPWGYLTGIRKAWGRDGNLEVTIGRNWKTWRWVALPPWPVVLREIIPDVLRRRPDLPVAKLAKRAIADPPSVSRPSAWSKIALLIVASVLALLPLLARHATLIWSLPVMAFAFLILPALGLIPTQRPRAVDFVAPLVAMAISSLPFSLLLGVPLRTIDAMTILVGGAFALAAAFYAFEWRMKPALIVLILVLLTAGSIAVYEVEGALGLKSVEITGVLGPGQHSSDFAWSPDGNLAIEAWPEGAGAVPIDTTSLRPLTLSDPGEHTRTYNIGRTGVLQLTERKGDLLFRRFEDGRKTVLASGMTIRHPLRSISPNENRICWLEEANEPQDRRIMTYDLRAGQSRWIDPNSPDANAIGWEQCWWADDQTLVAQGLSPIENWYIGYTALHILRIDLASGEEEHIVTAERFKNWRASPDGLSAFACDPEANDVPASTCFLDLRSGRKVYLSGSTLPCWQRDGLAAWRVLDCGKDGIWLCRFRPQTAKEERVYRMPEGASLASLSPRGHFAILRCGPELRLRPYWLVEVATGEVVRVDVPLFSEPLLFGFRGGTPWIGAYFDRWSPDETRFALATFTLPEGRFKTGVRLFEVPRAWQERLKREQAEGPK